MAYQGKPQEQFALEELFISGYQDKLQQDEVPQGAAIAGSSNFILDDDGKWTTRPGTQYLGTPVDPDELSGGCTSAARLRLRDGEEIPVVAANDFTRYLNPDQNRDPLFPTVPGTPDWVLFQTGFTVPSQFGFAQYDRSSDNLNKLIFCNGWEDYRIWSGAVDRLASWTINTITTVSSSGLATELFTPAGSIIVSNSHQQVTFTYTGVAGSTFTGVIPAPTDGFGPGDPFVGGEGIAQLPIQYPSAPKGNVLLCTNNARVLVANTLNTTTNKLGGGQVYGSKVDDPTDFTFASPRDPGDGFIVSYGQGGGTITGMSQKENLNYIFKPETIQLLSFTNDGEDFVIQQPLSSYDERTSADDGAVGPLGVFRGDNTITFVSPTNVINTVNRVQNIDYPQTLPISDPIKDTVDAVTFDDQTAGIGYRGRLFISCKSLSTATVNDLILVYNLRYRCWEAPILNLGIGAWFVYKTNLYGCLSFSPDVVQMEVGTHDFASLEELGIPINSQLTLRRNNYGSKSDLKVFDQYYIEGMMDEAGQAIFQLEYNEGTLIREGTLVGTETGFFFNPDSGGGFGTAPFGVKTFGPEQVPGWDVNARKFRLVLTTAEFPFYNLCLRIKTSSYFKLLSHGPNVRISTFVKPAAVYKAMTLTT